MQQQTNNRGGQAVAAGEEGPTLGSVASRWKHNSTSETADVKAWCGATRGPGSGDLTAAVSPPHHSHSRLTYALALTPVTSCRSVRRKPVEFDGRVAWEAYLAQFELLADAQGWDDAEWALQLVSCWRGPALGVLGHLAPAQRMVHMSVVEALQRKFGKHDQAEV